MAFPRRGLAAAALAAAVAWSLADAGEPLEPMVTDDFPGPGLADRWEPLEGNWRAGGGTLAVDDGGLIVLRTPPGGRFAMEFDIRMPTTDVPGMHANWISVIPLFSGPEDYAALYFGSADWRSFEKAGDRFMGLLIHPDTAVARDGSFRGVRVEADSGTVTLSIDGKRKEPVVFPNRPGSRIAFRSLPGSGRLEIRRFRLSKLPEQDSAGVHVMPIGGFADGRLIEDRGPDEVPGSAGSPDVDRSAHHVRFAYGFDDGEVFQSRFLRVPIEIDHCRALRLDIDGDGSRNAFFIVVHDASGEQHLLPPVTIAWTGRQEVDLSCEPFASSPPELERHAVHWGGDGNQRIDFPITTIDVGVVKRSGRVAAEGECSFHRPRRVE